MNMTRLDTTVEGILDDIANTNTSDDFLWGVLADALEDDGNPRSELVRLSRLLRSEPDHPEFAARQSRVQALLAGGMVPLVPRRTFGGTEFAYIPPGSFRMGSPETEESRRTREKQHAVKLTRGFYMGVYPVTQAQWLAVMGRNPSKFSRNGSKQNEVAKVSDADLARFPVESVSWDDSQEFCKKLSQKLGRRVRLPSEAEWEYACRAGTTTPFHFGSVLNGDLANCDGNHPYGSTKKGPYLARPTPVGLEAYPGNAWGLFDLHGNVWEWCQDAYLEDYQTLTNANPLNESGDRRVVRGGSWYDYSGSCRAAFRYFYAPGIRSNYIGLRVVVGLP